MMPLRVVERHLIDNSTRLRRIIVGDRGFETLALGRRLTQLAAQPAEQRDGRRAACHSERVQMP